MYINPKSIKILEELCLKQQAYSSRSRAASFRNDYEDFYFQEELKNHSTRKEAKRYDLSNIRSHDEFKMCLGSEFLNMDLSILDMNRKSHGLTHYLEMNESDYDEEEHYMPFMMNRHRNMSHNDMKQTFEFKFMMFEASVRMAQHAMREIFLVRDMLNCSPLVREWFDFAKQHDVNIDVEMENVIKFLEKENGSFEIYKNLKQSFNEVIDDAFDLLDKGYYIMKNHFRNDPHHMFISPMNSMCDMRQGDALKYENDTVDDPKIIIELDSLQARLNTFKTEIRTSFVHVNNDSFDAKEIRTNNEVLVKSLFAAYNKLKDKITLPVTKAKFFAEDVSILVPNKKYDEQAVNAHLQNEKIKKSIMLVSENISHENIHYRKLVVFEDNTCAVLVDGQEHFEVFANINETKNLVKVGVLAYLKNILRKNPTISKVISTAFEKNIGRINESTERYYDRPFQLGKILVSIGTYFQNENILKSSKFDFIETCNKLISFEKIDDKMNKIIREHKIKKYAESIVSSKYKHLYNKQSYKLFKELYDLKIDLKTVQEMIGKKLAAVESEDMFNTNIQNMINTFNDFNMEAMKIKAQSAKAKIISDNNEMLILEIANFEQSKSLGSGSWCISRNKTYFDQYTENGAKQYFIYDFKLSSKSMKSLVGITVTKEMTIKAAHTKSDSQLNDKNIKDYLIAKLKAIADADKPKSDVPLGVVKRSKKSNNSSITNVNVANPNGLIIGF